jgi:hypothetical protein
MEVANTLAYYNAATIAAVKSFTAHEPRSSTIKLSTAVLNEYE